jgi:hypothetical protein
VGRWYGFLATHPAFDGRRLACPCCDRDFSATRAYTQHLVDDHAPLPHVVAYKYLDARAYDRLAARNKWSAPPPAAVVDAYIPARREPRRARSPLGPAGSADRLIQPLDDLPANHP